MKEDKLIIGICGFGTLGRAIHHGFAQMTDFRINDINQNISMNTVEEVCNESDYVFICVPTPYNEDTEKFDSSILDNVVKECMGYLKGKDTIVIIKSTCIPGTTDRYIKEHNYPYLVFSPEFLTARTAKLDFINPSRIIFGVNDKKLQDIITRLSRLFRPRYPGYNIRFTTPKAAELTKYIANTFFATKVSFFNEIYDICKASGVNYTNVMRLVLADGRIGNSHYDVPGHDGKRGFGMMCFPKDLMSFISYADELGIDTKVMKGAWDTNLRVRPSKDWKKIKGAISNESDDR